MLDSVKSSFELKSMRNIKNKISKSGEDQAKAGTAEAGAGGKKAGRRAEMAEKMES